MFPLFITLLFLGIFFLRPKKAEAGFFGNVWKLITGDSQNQSEVTSSAAISMPLMGSQASSAGLGGNAGKEVADPSSLSVTQDSALVGTRNPSGTLPTTSNGQIFIYTVVSGDTPGAIAEKFGISLNTLLWANDLRDSRSIKEGDTLIILPVSGVKYEVKKGDTLTSVAKRFRPKDEKDFDGFVNDILSYNGLSIDEKLEPGSEVIIPDGEVNISPTPSFPGRPSLRFANLPDFIGYYLRPIIGGRKTQGIHGFNGIDLANSCGHPVLATAGGRVLVAKYMGWNTGYAEYVVISHPNNTQSLYAHLGGVFVQSGESVSQGQTIGLIGSTGRSTGCHLHFEIRGARNPF